MENKTPWWPTTAAQGKEPRPRRRWLSPPLAKFLLGACILFATRAGYAGEPVSPHAESGQAGALLEQGLMWLTLNLARVTEGAAALVIAVASAKAMWSYLSGLAERGPDVPKEAIRLSLGRSLALALEFELGADILKTTVAPSWNAIGLLAAIAVLRTALNFFLERELERAEHHRVAGGNQPTTPGVDNPEPPRRTAASV